MLIFVSLTLKYGKLYMSKSHGAPSGAKRPASRNTRLIPGQGTLSMFGIAPQAATTEASNQGQAEKRQRVSQDSPVDSIVEKGQQQAQPSHASAASFLPSPFAVKAQVSLPARQPVHPAPSPFEEFSQGFQIDSSQQQVQQQQVQQLQIPQSQLTIAGRETGALSSVRSVTTPVSRDAIFRPSASSLSGLQEDPLISCRERYRMLSAAGAQTPALSSEHIVRLSIIVPISCVGEIHDLIKINTQDILPSPQIITPSRHYDDIAGNFSAGSGEEKTVVYYQHVETAIFNYEKTAKALKTAHAQLRLSTKDRENTKMAIAKASSSANYYQAAGFQGIFLPKKTEHKTNLIDSTRKNFLKSPAYREIVQGFAVQQSDLALSAAVIPSAIRSPSRPTLPEMGKQSSEHSPVKQSSSSAFSPSRASVLRRKLPAHLLPQSLTLQQPTIPGLDVVKIPGDGNCLYTSVIQGAKLALEVEGLRNRVADHLSRDSNFRDNLKTQVTQSLLDYNKSRSENEFSGYGPTLQRIFIGSTSRILQEEPIEKIVDEMFSSHDMTQIYLQGMRNSGCGCIWGGEIELKAIAQLFNLNFLVYKNTGQAITELKIEGSRVAASPAIRLLLNADHYDLLVPSQIAERAHSFPAPMGR